MEFNHFGKCLCLALSLHRIYILIQACVCGVSSLENEYRQGQWRDIMVSVSTHLAINLFGTDAIMLTRDCSNLTQQLGAVNSWFLRIQQINISGTF